MMSMVVVMVMLLIVRSHAQASDVSEAMEMSELCANDGIQNLTKFAVTEFEYTNGRAIITVSQQNVIITELCQSLCTCGEELMKMTFNDIQAGIEVLQLEQFPISIAFSGVNGLLADGTIIITVISDDDPSSNDYEQTDYRFNLVQELEFNHTSSKLTFQYQSLFTETTGLEGNGRHRRKQRRKLVGDGGLITCYDVDCAATGMQR